MLKIVWFCLIGIFGWGLNAWADETWVGTIGNKEVVVCMVENQPKQYFYQTHKTAIGLMNVADSDILQETPLFNSEPIYGYWQINSKTPKQLKGIWQDAKHENSQAINLSFFSNGKRAEPLYYHDSGNCGDDNYYSFLIKNLKIKIKPQPFKKQIYQAIKSENVTGFQLSANHSIAQQAINRYAKQLFEEGFAIQHDCYQKIDFSLKPIYWSKQWLVLHYQSGMFNCFSSYSEIIDEKFTFNYQTGEMVRTYQWLKGWQKESFFQTEDTLKPLIEVARRFEPKSDADSVGGCRAEFSNFSPPYLTTKGLAFDMSYRYMCQSANNTVILPKKVLKPFLTKAGLAAMEDLN